MKERHQIYNQVTDLIVRIRTRIIGHLRPHDLTFRIPPHPEPSFATRDHNFADFIFIPRLCTICG